MKKILLLFAVVMMCVPAVWAADTSTATTLKEFKEELQKGQTKVYTGEVVCTFNDGTYVYFQDQTAGMYVNAYGVSIVAGEKFKNAEISMSKYGANICSIGKYNIVERGVTVTPTVVKLADLEDYVSMLVRVEGLTFKNAGYKFELDTTPAPLKETVTEGRTEGYVCPFDGNLIGSIIPEEANVTGIAFPDLVLRPRSLSDMEVVKGSGEATENFARFLERMTHYGSEVYPGELIVSYAKREASVVTLIVQDDSAGVFSYLDDTNLKPGDKIKNAVITQVSSNGRYAIGDYTLVSEGNTITPKVVTAYQMGDNSPYRYMLVKVENVGIKPSEAGVYTINGAYPILTDGANVESAMLSTAFCRDMVGMSIPKQANLTGILFFGYQVRPITPDGVEAIGLDMASSVIDECATVADVRKSTADVLRLAGPVDVTYMIENSSNNGFGTLFMQDATGGLQVEMAGIAPADIKAGVRMKDVSFNIVNKALTISRIGDKVAEITEQDVAVAPRVILPGGLNSSTIGELQYTLVEYAGVKFTGNEPKFSDSYTYNVTDGNVQCMIYPYSGLNGMDVPEEEVNVCGLAMYNPDLSAYIVRPRYQTDITIGDPTKPYIFLSTAALALEAELGNEATGSVDVTTRNCTAPVVITRSEASATQLITPDKTSLEPSEEAQKVTFTFSPEEAGTVVETFEFTTEGLATPVSLTVTASGVAGIQIVNADANGVYRVFATTGVKVLETRDAEALRTLPAGLYIVNGRKLVIRR